MAIKLPLAATGYQDALLAARLEKVSKSRDFMRAALLEEAELSKGVIPETLNPATAASEIAKLPFWKRFAAKKMMGEDFFPLVYGQPAVFSSG